MTVLLVLHMDLITALPSGACEGSCFNMPPIHMISNEDESAIPQTSEVPITIRLSTKEVMQGQTVTVTLEGQNGFLFRGFLVTARTKTAVPEVVGRFVITDGMRLMNCKDLPEISVATHRNSSKLSSVQLAWLAPENFEGDVRLS